MNVTINSQYPYLYAATVVRNPFEISKGGDTVGVGNPIHKELTGEEAQKKWDFWKEYFRSVWHNTSLGETDPPSDLLMELKYELGLSNLAIANGRIKLYLYGTNDVVLDTIDFKLPSRLYDKAVNVAIDSPPTLANAAPEVENIDGSILANSNYFKLHPSAILGTEKTVRTKYNKEVSVVTGSLDDAIAKLPKPHEYTIMKLLGKQNHSGTMKSKSNLVKDGSLEAIHEMLTLKKAAKRNDNDVEAVLAALDSMPDESSTKVQLSRIVPFEESIKLLNSNLSDDDIAIYLYHKKQIGDAWEGKWQQTKYYRDIENITSKKIKEWCESGKLVFDGLSYIPAFIFFSGNVKEKLSLFESNRDAIVGMLGERYYEIILESLEKIVPKPLSITAKDENERLYISVHHDLVTNTYVISPSDKEKLESGELLKAQDTLPMRSAFWRYLLEQPLPPGTNTYDIQRYYLDGKMPNFSKDDTPNEKQAKIAIKQLNVKAGEELWSNYLRTGLHAADQKKLEDKFNAIYNNFLPLDSSKIPVAFEYAREFKEGVPTDIRDEKREAIAFMANEGSMILAYDVGVGKTWSAIFTIAHNLDCGYTKRPVIITPTSVYNQFTKELKELLPHIKVNEFGNLGASFIEGVVDSKGIAKKVDAGSITIITIEALKKLGLSRDSEDELTNTLIEILNQGVAEDKNSRELALFAAQIEKLVGKVQSEAMLFIDDFGWDFAVVDEAHSMKNLFTTVKGKVNEDSTRRESSKYHTSGKKASARALKGFCVLNYIQSKNKFRNVLLMTATPFTNSPLEIFSMLSLVAYYKLKNDYSLANAHEFYSTFADVSYELVVKAGNVMDMAEVVKGFNNLKVLSSIIRRFLLYKTGEDVGLIRPIKTVLPVRTKVIDGKTVKLNEDEAISTLLKPSEMQIEMFEEIDNFIETGTGLSLVCNPFEELGLETNDTIFDEGPKSKAGVRILRAISYYKKIILSPYMLFEDCGIPLPSAKDLVENSPKLMYTMLCIKSVKEHCERKKTTIAGQVIYLNMGSEILPLLKSYLVEVIGFGQSEVDFITGATSSDKRDSVKNAFNEGRVKVIIGSSAMKEGMNLQTRGAVLYNLTLDWNPTDIKQLEGRIWRQGNQFNNVRMVIPMLADSSDSFILQKLDEKTARINEIFSTNGKTNTLKLDELNPEEIKYELITDPKKRARAEINDEKMTLDYEQQGTVAAFEQLEKDILTFSEPSGDLINMILAIQHVDPEFKPKEDFTLEKAIGKFSRMKSEAMKEPDAVEYEVMKVFHPSSFYGNEFSFSLAKYTAIRDNLKNAKRLAKIYNKGNPISLNFLLNKKQELSDNLLKVTKKIEEFNYEKRVIQRTEELELIRENTKGMVGLPNEQAKKFASLNWMLDDLRVSSSAPKKEAAVIISNPPLLEPQKCPPTDSKGIPLVDSNSLEQLDRCIASLTSTKALYTDAKGRYTAERLKLHSKIIEHFTAIKPCHSEQPIAILTGGLPGAGKSTFIKKSGYNWMLDSDLVYHIDADEVREYIPEYKGWNANQTHAEVRDVVDAMFDKIGKPCTHHLLYDGTMKSYKEYYGLIDKLLGLGYKVYIIFILIDGETAKQRVLQRYQHGNGKFHRYVPLYLVDNNSGMGRQPLDELKDKVSGYVLVDGINQEVIEKGGEEIPVSVSQFDAPKKEKKVEIPEIHKTTTNKPNKAETQKRIEGLKMVLKYGAEGHDITAVRLRLKSLQTTLNYI